jgi:general secretion pathway protein A
MYHEYFGLSESPFSITPDPRFFYSNSVYLEAYANLRYGIEAKRGFIAVTGEVGTGKTMLLRKLMRELHDVIDFVFVVNTHLTFNELLRVILDDLSLPAQGKDRLAMLHELNAYLLGQLDRGRIVCLLIDEAQHLTDECLEEIRLLSNFETDREKLLQIVLMGQPELKTKLDQPKLRQLKQRIVIHSEIAPLNEHEVGAYIDSRLLEAGYKGKDLFHPKAVKQVALYSKGIPRLINAICDNALLITFAASHKSVSADIIKEVAKDLRLRLESVSGEVTKQIEFTNVVGKTAVGQPKEKDSKRIFGTTVRIGFAALAVIATVVLFVISTADLGRLFKVSERVPSEARRDASVVTPSMRNVNERVRLPSGQQTVADKRDEEILNAPVKNPEIDVENIFNRVIIKQGTTISTIANDAYGGNAVLGMDLIKEFNPQINDLNWISAGQELLLPVLKGRTLVRQQTDGSYRLIVSSFLTRTEADQLGRYIGKEGYQVVITSNRASTGLLLHRVEIDGLKNLEDAIQALEAGLKNQWFTGKAPSGNRRTRADLGNMPPELNRGSDRAQQQSEKIPTSMDRRVILALEGSWYVNGDREKRTAIISSREGIATRNERGQTSRLELSKSGGVFAPAWGLRGDVRRDRIEWQNGTTWTREPLGNPKKLSR